jgi:Transposase DDE domain
MAASPCPPLTAEDLQGFKYFRLLGPLLARLHTCGLERDRAGNRQLFYEQYVTVLLLYFFSPLVTSLRGLQQASTLAAVQQRLGIRQPSLGSLSDAASVFDAALLHEVIAELGARLHPQVPLTEQAALQHLTAIDGSLLPARPKMVWALWQDGQHRAAKMHVAVEVLRQVPVGVTVTAGNASERTELRRLVKPGGFYVMDRGYADYALFQELHDLPCSFLVRVQYNAAYEVQEERPVTAAAAAAGVSRDCLLRRLGTEHHTRLLPQPFRVVVLDSDKTRPDGTPDRPVLVTNRLDLAAESVALAFRYRWAVERTQSWRNRFRHILVRWDKKPEHYLAFLHFACALIVFRAAGLFG